jgi:hypothetical protein
MLRPIDDITTAFLHYVLPEHGLFVAAIKKKDGQFKRTIFASSKEELAEILKYWDRQGLNSYFAIASFKEARHNDPKAAAAEKKWGRTQRNVLAVKVFPLDFDDVGEGKFYKTANDVYTAVIAFCLKYKLPTPIFVSSGRGTHVYWVLLVEIDPTTWKRYAEGLKHLCQEFGLRIDRSITANSATVLRAPDTHNRKPEYKQPLPVEIDPKSLDHPFCTLDQLAAFAEASARAAPGRATKAGTKRTSKEVTKLTSRDHPPSYASKIVKHCGQLQHMCETGGQIDEPLWYACHGVLTYCVDGEEKGHEWSQGDARYDDAETQDKLERWRAATTGATTCKRFHELNPSICEQCQYWGTKLNSPITLGIMLPGQAEAEAAAEAEAKTNHKFKELDELIKQLPEDARHTLDFELTKTGFKQHSYINARSGLIILQRKCSYDVFHDRKFMDGELLSDEMVHALRDRMTRLFKVDFGEAAVFAALQLLCETNKYDPVVDELKLYQAQWDHVFRLDQGAIAYLGSPDTPLNRAIFRKSMIALVRRARKPGCKFDFLPILEGPQGNLKSTFLRILAGSDANFSDQPLLHKDDKAQQELMAGVWVYEIGELVGLRKTEVEALKGFLSRTYDRARPAYGRIRLDQPRRGVAFGTTNEIKYLRDLTGNRRIWPLTTGVIDIPTFECDRPQVLGEAAYHEAQGESLMLPQNLWEAAAEAQEARMEKHHWEDLLADVQGEETVSDGKGGWEERVSTQTLIRTFLQLPSGYYNVDTRRIAAIMRKNGWQDDRMKFKAPPTPGDPSGTRTVTKNGYRRPANEPPKEAPRTPVQDICQRLEAAFKLPKL